MLLCFIEYMFGLSFALLYDQCSHFYVTVLVYVINDRNLLVILYLSFYYLLYLEGLMCFVQVFQATSIYVPSASQLLIILKGRNFKHFQFILFKFIFSILFILCPCCFCKLLELFSCICRLLQFVPCLCNLYALLYIFHAHQYTFNLKHLHKTHQTLKVKQVIKGQV